MMIADAVATPTPPAPTIPIRGPAIGGSLGGAGVALRRAAGPAPGAAGPPGGHRHRDARPHHHPPPRLGLARPGPGSLERRARCGHTRATRATGTRPLRCGAVSPNQKPRKSPPKLGESQTQPWVKAVVVLVVVALVIVGAVALFGNNDDSSDTNVSTEPSSQPSGATGSTPTTPAAASVKGKPCVAMADTPPAGAPQVPVKVGPAPTALVSEDLEAGSGAEAVATSTVTVDYIGVSC